MSLHRILVFMSLSANNTTESRLEDTEPEKKKILFPPYFLSRLEGNECASSLVTCGNQKNPEPGTQVLA